jgi:hypothetical protein
MTRLAASAALIAMVSALQAAAPAPRRDLLSSRSMDNFQTLDIHHYMLLSTGVTESAFVPISGRSPDVVEMSELNLVLDPRFELRDDPEIERLHSSLEDLYSGYLKYALDPNRDDPQARAYRMVFSSISLFRRSFAAERWRATISLGTAFEQLLCQGAPKEAVSRGKKRIRRMLGKGARANAAATAFEDVYKTRGEILHEGREKTSFDLVAARRAFVECVVAITPLLKELGPDEPHLGRLLDRD